MLCRCSVAQLQPQQHTMPPHLSGLPWDSSAAARLDSSSARRGCSGGYGHSECSACVAATGGGGQRQGSSWAWIENPQPAAAAAHIQTELILAKTAGQRLQAAPLCQHPPWCTARRRWCSRCPGMPRCPAAKDEESQAPMFGSGGGPSRQVATARQGQPQPLALSYST